MKKSISFIPVSNALLKYLYEKIEKEEVEGKEELLSALKELLEGKSEFAMLLPEKEDRRCDNTLHLGALTIIPASRRVIKNGKEISLTPKEFDILYFLASNRGEAFTKERIYQEVWNDDYLLDDNNIMAFIRKLRKKIEDRPDEPEYILTVWGIGYMFSDSF